MQHTPPPTHGQKLETEVQFARAELLPGRVQAMLGQGEAAMRHANGPLTPRPSTGVRRRV